MAKEEKMAGWRRGRQEKEEEEKRGEDRSPCHAQPPNALVKRSMTSAFFASCTERMAMPSLDW